MRWTLVSCRDPIQTASLVRFGEIAELDPLHISQEPEPATEPKDRANSPRQDRPSSLGINLTASQDRPGRHRRNVRAGVRVDRCERK